MRKVAMLTQALSLSFALSACGPRNHHDEGPAKIKAAVVAAKVTEKPVDQKRNVREIQDHIFSQKMKLRGLGYHGFDGFSIPSWVNDWKGYEPATLKQIKATLLDIKEYAAVLKEAGADLGDAELQRKADVFTMRANRSLKKVGRWQREASALQVLTTAMKLK